MTKILSNFINGEFVAPREGKYIDRLNPATGKLNAQVPDSDEQDVEAAVSAATAAFRSWSRTPREKRSKLLHRIADLLESRLEEFAVEESKDQGKPVSLALTVDIPRAVQNFRYFANFILTTHEKSSQLDGVAVNYVQKSPAGVAGLISPWNLPLYLLTWKIAPAMAFGCTCVCKPSEFTSVTAWMLCSLIKEAGVPDGVVNMVFGTGPKAGAAIVAHPNVPLISFTGGTVTGRAIYHAAAPFNKKLSLELGGKNANIIFADANFDEAVATTIRSSFANQGEVCLAGSRIFVQDIIYDRFVSALTARANALIVGDPADRKTEMGALISKQHLEKVLSYVDIAVQE
ncbi:Aldehyde dehydrogenase 8 member A1, partial [Borealophlyctis nickersoniae]